MPSSSSAASDMGETTREKILVAATDLFIEQGYDATSISQIARQAKVNRSLIFHHFENKSRLWVTCKTCFFEQHNTSMEAIFAAARESRAAFIELTVVQRFRFYQANPRFVRFIAWQSLDKEDKAQTDMMHQILTRSCATVEALQAQGEVSADVDAKIVLLQITSMVSGYFIKNLTQWVSAEEEERYLASVVATVEKMLSP